MKNDRNVGVSLAKVFTDPESVVTRHPHVEDHATRILVDGPNAVETVDAGAHFVLILENLFEGGPDAGVVVDDDDDRLVAEHVGLVASNQLLQIIQ